jgi:MFS family permease
VTATAPAGIAAPSRERRDLGLLAAGMLISVAGDAAATVALLLELHTHGTVWVSAMLAAELVPFPLFASLSGRLVDRVDNRRLLVAALLAQGAVAVPLAFVRSPWAIVALVFTLAIASTVVRPAVNAMVPVLASEARAPSGYAWIATATSVGWIGGPALGGGLTAAFGVTATLLVDAGTFVVIAAACGLLAATRGRSGSAEATPDHHGGMSIVWRDSVLRWSLLATVVVVACAVIDNVAAPFRFLDQLDASSAEYGGYLALWGIGALGGAQLPRRLRPDVLPAALAAGNALCGLGILGIGLAPDVAVAFGSSVVGGIGNGIANVSLNALVASRVAADQRGRAFAATGGIIQSGTGLGTIAGAPLVSALTASRAMITAGGVAAAIATVTAAWSARTWRNSRFEVAHNPRR